MAQEEAGKILDGLALKKNEWAEMSIASKKRILREIGERVTDWGAGYDAGQQHMLIRKVHAVDEGAGMVAAYGALISIVLKKSVDTVIKGLDENYQVPRFDLKKEFQIEENCIAFETDHDFLTSSRTILFTETEERGKFYKKARQQSEITIILGAGNHALLSILDAIYWMFVEGRVCIVKHNPIQADMIPHFDHFLRPLIRGGFLVSINASHELTTALIHRPLTDHVHLTGGIKTHDNIVFGTEDQEARKRENRPVLRARMTSELGAVTPYIVLPSASQRDTEWTDAAVANQAAICALSLLDNVSCNCLAAKVLSLSLILILALKLSLPHSHPHPRANPPRSSSARCSSSQRTARTSLTASSPPSARSSPPPPSSPPGTRAPATATSSGSPPAAPTASASRPSPAPGPSASAARPTLSACPCASRTWARCGPSTLTTSPWPSGTCRGPGRSPLPR